jgi:hypothetical protein
VGVNRVDYVCGHGSEVYPVAGIVSRLVDVCVYRYLMCGQRAARLSGKWVASGLQEGSLLMYMRIGFVWKPDAMFVCMCVPSMCVQLVCVYNWYVRT